MGAWLSKVSCSCSINPNPNNPVHDHGGEPRQCPRCAHTRRGAESRASATTTSTEELPRPRYSSPAPERIHRSHALSATTSGIDHPAYRIPDCPRYIAAYDDTDSPSSFTASTIPSSRAASLTARTIARLEMEALADWHRANRRNPRAGGVGGRATLDETEEPPPTPSDISHSSTIVCCGSEAGSRPGSRSSHFTVGADMRVGSVNGAGIGREEGTRRENARECAVEDARQINGGRAGVNQRMARRSGR